MAKSGSGNNRMLKKVSSVLEKIIHFPIRSGYSTFYVYASYIGQTKTNFMKQHSKVFARIADTNGKNVVFMIYQM